MALQKEITENNGVVTNYHRITRICIDPVKEKQSTVRITVASYVSESIRRQSEGKAATVREYTFVADLEEIDTTIWQYFYDMLKAQTMFYDAADVREDNNDNNV